MILETLMDQAAIASNLEEMAGEIVEKYASQDIDLALVGIRDRGELLADRLHKILQARFKKPIDLGTLDITMYRDDINQAGSQSLQVGTTDITFNIDDKVVLLVDDVLNTGRSVRAALDALVALGRPKAIRLAVLIDRGSREYPISADYVGLAIENVPENIKVQVWLKECDEKEAVVLIEKE